MTNHELQWVRHLIHYTEDHPLTSTIKEVNIDHVPTLFPNEHPNERKDANLLQLWINDMIKDSKINIQKSCKFNLKLKNLI